MNTRSKEIHKHGTKTRIRGGREGVGDSRIPTLREVKKNTVRKGRRAADPSPAHAGGCPILIGIPFDAASSYLRGTADAAPKIREALACDAANQWTETGVDLGVQGIYEDAGDLEYFEEDALAAIENAVGELLDLGKRPVSLGGDHSITFPIVKAAAKKHSKLTIFHFDAHPDLYDEFEGNRWSHACPFARIMESGLAERLVQIGIRTINGHQREQAKRFGVEVIEMRQLPAYARLKAAGPVYISFDMDVLDPAYAPGISHREPGGMSVREAIAHLHAIEGQIVGADVVEYNPVRDVSEMTATVAAKILKEILGKMIAR
jgi:agmatinase